MHVPPPHRPRGSGDGWVELEDGRRFWGLGGAAGLLVVSPTGSVLLQHRVAWSHFGDTWGVPGGARNLGESAIDGALREAREETGIDTAALRPRFEVLLDLVRWSYATIAVDAPAELAVEVADVESTALAWVPADDVQHKPLHPGFAAAWPDLRRRLDAPRRVVLVDVANVMGSRPDGWWRDRPAAADRIVAGLDALARAGSVVPLDDADDAATARLHRVWPTFVAVVEGQARHTAPTDRVRVVAAPKDGDATIVDEAARLLADGNELEVVTADRELRARVSALGAGTSGPAALLQRLDELEV
jgi:8-oxo-dGTP diphosphatase